MDCDSELAKLWKDSTAELHKKLRESLEKHLREQNLLLQVFARKVGAPKTGDYEFGEVYSLPVPSSNPNEYKCAGDRTVNPTEEQIVLSTGLPADTVSADDRQLSPAGGSDSAASILKVAAAYEGMVKEHAAEKEQKRRGNHVNFIDRFAESIRFDFIVGAVIAMNVIVMLFQLEFEGRMLEGNVFRGEDQRHNYAVEEFFIVCEHIFTVFFAFELVFRLAALGFTYLKSTANVFDAGIVVVCSLDAWVFTPMKSDAMSNTALIRLLRLIRLAKVFRVLRLMKAFAALRVLLAAIINSIGALLWSMTLLFVFELVGALLMARVVQPMIMDPLVDPELRIFLWETFGTCFQAYISMFELTMWPGAISKYRRLYEEVSPGLALFFVGYSILVTFAVVRVITAMFLKATLAAAAADEGKLNALKIAERSTYVELLKGAMTTADSSGDMLCEEEFALINEMPRMSQWLDEEGMAKMQQHMLFDALEVNGKISYAEFLHAVERMSGPAHVATDLVVQLYQTRKTHRNLTVLLEGLMTKGRRLDTAKEEQSDSRPESPGNGASLAPEVSISDVAAMV